MMPELWRCERSEHAISEVWGGKNPEVAGEVREPVSFYGTGMIATDSFREVIDYFSRNLQDLWSIQGLSANFSVCEKSPYAIRGERYSRLAHLMEAWLEDDSGYDEEVWPLLEKDLEEGIRFRGEED